MAHAKIVNIYFPMLEWDVPYIVEKLKKRAFQHKKINQVGRTFRKIWP